jgi:hypothetical protein
MTTNNHDRKEGRSANTGLAKVAVQCSIDTFVVNQSLVLRINPPRRMLKIATFAKPENVSGKQTSTNNKCNNRIYKNVLRKKL